MFLGWSCHNLRPAMVAGRAARAACRRLVLGVMRVDAVICHPSRKIVERVIVCPLSFCFLVRLVSSRCAPTVLVMIFSLLLHSLRCAVTHSKSVLHLKSVLQSKSVTQSFIQSFGQQVVSGRVLFVLRKMLRGGGGHSAGNQAVGRKEERHSDHARQGG